MCLVGQWQCQVLGLGDTVDRGVNPGQMGDMLPAVDLGVGHTAVALTAGNNYMCALLDNGGIKCWGIKKKGDATKAWIKEAGRMNHLKHIVP